MRKLKLQVQITADGFVAGPEGQLDWITWDMDERSRESSISWPTRVTRS